MERIRNFMMGRYGADQLTFALLGLYLVLAIVSNFVGAWMWLLAVALMVYTMWRTFSRHVDARRRENERFLAFWNPIASIFRKKKNQLKDRTHCYFSCPACKATLRLPKGKGKISITCPRCRKEFIKRT